MNSSAARAGRPMSFGRYRIEGALGRGGMAVVYRAVDAGTGRVVALKRLENPHATAAVLFEREYYTLSSLKHPSVIEAYDFGIDEHGHRYYTMELLEGDDLATLAPLEWRAVCRHLRDVAASLALLHARKLVHRDISPRNVRLCAGGRAKLIDFGALAPFGVASEIAGTPMCLSPEALRGDELDQRTDLFSLGAVAYYALTRDKPYPVKGLRDQDCEFLPPRAPSAYHPEIPASLDDLVLALLSPDPQERPASAADVVERLNAIAQLEEAPAAQLAESHLLSTALCGRERERGQLAQHMNRAMRGEGCVVVLEGSAGMGRTRLAADALVSARLAGLSAVRIGVLAHPTPHGPLLAMIRALLEALPSEAEEALAAHLPVLGDALPELRGEARAPDGSAAAATLVADTAERRARIQDAFVQWVLAIAARRPLVLIVDDVHACDTISAGALAALSHSLHSSRMMLLVTQALGEDAPVAVQQIARSGARIRLRGLDSEALQALLTSALGDVPGRARLSQWLHDAAQGNPAQSLELLASLIDRGVVRYASGSWSLPSELRDEDLPASLEEALSARVAALDEHALELARLFALHQGGLSLLLCNQLLPEVDRRDLFSALDRLLSRQLVSVAGDSYRLRQHALRPLLLRGLSAERIRALHLKLASALLAAYDLSLDARLDAVLTEAPLDVLGAALQAGWHFVRGGDVGRGGELLRSAGIELTHRGDGLTEAVPALEAAIETYAALGRSRYEIAYLQVPLVLAGTYSDFRLSYRYGEPLLELLCDATGLAQARRWSRFLGGRLALALALPLAFVRYHGSRERQRAARSFREGFLGVLSIACAVIGCSVPLLDTERAARVLRSIAPLASFPRSHVTRLVHDFVVAMVHATAGRYGRAREVGRAVLARLRAPGGVKGLPESARVQLEAGLHVLLGSLDANRTDGSVRQTFAALEQLHTSVSRQTLAGARAAHHAGRGERELFERWQREVDVLAAQSGSTWRQDVMLPRNNWWLHALCEDVMGLKHAMRRLEAIAAEAPTLAPTRDAATACYLAERGNHAEALQRYRHVFEAALAEPSALGLRFVGAYARILRGAGHPEQARDVCERALARLSPEDDEFTVLSLGPRLEHALAVADLGRLDEAAALLDQLVEQQRSHDNPMLRALAHRARAAVAIRMEDRDAVEEHLAITREQCKRSENPALIALARRLERDARAAGLLETAGPQSLRAAAAATHPIGELRDAFARCRGPSERLQLALDSIVSSARAECGYLYLLDPSGLRFAAPLAGIEPPERLREELQRELDGLGGADEETSLVDAEPIVMRTVVDPDEQPELVRRHAGGAYRSVLLTTLQGGKLVAAGAIALVRGDEPLAPLPHVLIEEVARTLFDAGDLNTVFVGSKRGP